VGKWEVLDFEEVILDDTKNATKIKKEDYLEQGLYPIIDQGQNLIAGYRNNHDGLYSNVPVIVFGDHTRIIKYIDTPFFLGADGVKLLKSKRENLDYKYLYYYFINKQIPNTGYNRHFKWLKKLVIPIPPLETQKEIAKTLDTAAELLALRKQQLAELDNLIKSIFCDMFGDPITNEKGWPFEKLIDITTKIGSGATPKGGKESYKDKGISLIRSMNVYNGLFSYDQLAYIDEQQAKRLDNVTIQEKDVLINITGASVARSCIVPSDVLPARVNQHVSIVRVKEEKVNSVYINNVFISSSFQTQLLKVAGAGGATREAITKQQLQELIIPLPPLPLQNQFATIVTKIEEQKALVKKAIDETQYLFDSLMSEYFD
jgi:type I restriction enzyme S subunit